MTAEASDERGALGRARHEPERIEAALRELLRESHAENDVARAGAGSQPVVVADREWRGEVVNRLERVGRYHPSRTILCTVEDDRREIDGYATVSGDVAREGGDRRPA